MKLIIGTVAAIAAAALLAACGSAAGPQSAHSTAAATVAAAKPSVPVGCQQAVIAIATVRTELESTPQDTTAASRQLAALARSIPVDALRLDIDRANVDLTFYAERAAIGQSSATTWLKHLVTDLSKINAECGGLMTDLTITATELGRRLGEMLRLVEHGTTITVVDGKHPDWVRAVITPPPARQVP